jgi:hypothetical protein
MYVEFTTENQTTFPVWENIYLINAASEDEAFKKAEIKGRESAGDNDGSFQWNNHPARWVFLGVRKLTLCQNPDERPSDGTELTYLQMRVRSRSALTKLVNSDRVAIELIEPFAEEGAPKAHPTAASTRAGQ